VVLQRPTLGFTGSIPVRADHLIMSRVFTPSFIAFDEFLFSPLLCAASNFHNQSTIKKVSLINWPLVLLSVLVVSFDSVSHNNRLFSPGKMIPFVFHFVCFLGICFLRMSDGDQMSTCITRYNVGNATVSTMIFTRSVRPEATQRLASPNFNGIVSYFSSSSLSFRLFLFPSNSSSCLGSETH